jgi:membrane-bound lytic murein transglycosylase D
MTEDELRDVNRIPAAHAGQGRLDPAGAPAARSAHDVTEHVADNATMALAPEALPLAACRSRSARGDPWPTRHGMTAVRWPTACRPRRFKPGQLVTVLQPQRKVTHTRLAASPRPAARKAVAPHRRPAPRVAHR